MAREVLAVIGVGGMGQAIARRLGAGKTVLLADYNEGTLASVAESLAADGHHVESL
ncbi:MAG TPA: NAD(P)-binding domain-containing protein, partial [Mycobacterium sp.]